MMFDPRSEGKIFAAIKATVEKRPENPGST